MKQSNFQSYANIYVGICASMHASMIHDTVYDSVHPSIYGSVTVASLREKPQITAAPLVNPTKFKIKDDDDSIPSARKFIRM